MPRVKPLDRIEESEISDLHEIVQRLTAVEVAERELPRERHEAVDEFVASAEITLAVVHLEELVLG